MWQYITVRSKKKKIQWYKQYKLVLSNIHIHPLADISRLEKSFLSSCSLLFVFSTVCVALKLIRVQVFFSRSFSLSTTLKRTVFFCSVRLLGSGNFNHP